jgi:type I restriction enzyme S subunit
MGEWKEQFLEEVMTLKRGYDLSAAKRLPGTVPIVTSSGFGETHSVAMAQPPGVVTGRYGTIGQVFFVTVPYWPLNTTLYVKDFKGNDERFIYYFLKTFDFEKFNDKSTIPGINRNHLYKEVVRLPDSLDEQRAIASVLCSLDAKIDLLHRQNKTLEAMAETLFRQWFVEEAEEGWEEIGLLDLVQLVPGGTPKTTEGSYWDGDIMWISVREISENHKGFVNYAYKTITETGLNNSAAHLLPKFGTVISARGTVGKIGLLAQPMAYSQSNFGVLPKDSSNYFFTYLLVHNSIEELHSNSYGAVFDTITTQSFKTIRHRLPGTEVINSFEKLVGPMFLKMLNNTEQITSLTALRDTLLPKLMSGEVRVEETI